MAEISAGEDVLRTIRDAATVPIPEQPHRSQFASEERFAQAWDDWQAEALERALSALDTIATLTGTDRAAPVQPWTPGELLSVSLLRSALTQAERNPAAWPYSAAELARARALVERTNPQVSVATPNAVVGGERWTGWAWDASHWIPPGVYDATGAQDGHRYRLVVGPVADRVAGESSAAFRVGDADRAIVDQLAATLTGLAPGHLARTLDHAVAVIEDSGRDVDAARQVSAELARAERARAALPSPLPQHAATPPALAAALSDRAAHINPANPADELTPAHPATARRL